MPNADDRRVSLIEGQFNIDLSSTIKLLTQSTIVWHLTIEDHDKEMAVQQAILHRTILVLGDMLDKCNGSTYISKKVIELRDRIVSGNIDVYSGIQNNIYLPEQLKKLTSNLENFNINKMFE